MPTIPYFPRGPFRRRTGARPAFSSANKTCDNRRVHLTHGTDEPLLASRPGGCPIPRTRRGLRRNRAASELCGASLAGASPRVRPSATLPLRRPDRDREREPAGVRRAAVRHLGRRPRGGADQREAARPRNGPDPGRCASRGRVRFAGACRRCCSRVACIIGACLRHDRDRRRRLRRLHHARPVRAGASRARFARVAVLHERDDGPLERARCCPIAT